MTFLSRVLQPPTYGYERDGKLYVPTHSEILKEFFYRLNIFRDIKNWLSLFGWSTTLSFAIPLFIFLFYFFSWSLLIAGFIYSMVILGSHGTVWLHRYSTHRAFKFRSPAWRFICRNLVIKIVPEETYVISHHVHHKFSEKSGDPYNVYCGWLYCFLADVNHQPIAKDLSEEEYRKLTHLLDHTGVRINSYGQYLKWGSLCHPLYTTLHFVLNWVFWYGAFYWVGGHSLATALFGMSGVWAIGVRTFNYDGHGRGKDRRRPGIDFYRGDISINQVWPGYVAGEWHNNHHLYPKGARAGFLPYQIDFPWYFVCLYHGLGGISSYYDPKPDFLKDYYVPFIQSKKLSIVTS